MSLCHREAQSSLSVPKEYTCLQTCLALTLTPEVASEYPMMTLGFWERRLESVRCRLALKDDGIWNKLGGWSPGYGKRWKEGRWWDPLLGTMSRSTCVIGDNDGKMETLKMKLRALAHPRNSGGWQKHLSKGVRWRKQGFKWISDSGWRGRVYIYSGQGATSAMIQAFVVITSSMHWI